MKRILLFLVLAFAALPVFAQSEAEPNVGQRINAELAKMTDAEKAEALERLTTKGKMTDSAKRAQEWIDIGNGIGTGLAATAEKLGIAVNQFAQTPVGKMAMFLILWNYLGDDLTGIICGVLWLLVFLPFWYRNFRNTFGIFNEKGKFVKLDHEMFRETSTFGTIVWSYIIGLCAIGVVFIIFIA